MSVLVAQNVTGRQTCRYNKTYRVNEYLEVFEGVVDDQSVRECDDSSIVDATGREVKVFDCPVDLEKVTDGLGPNLTKAVHGQIQLSYDTSLLRSKPTNTPLSSSSPSSSSSSPPPPRP